MPTVTRGLPTTLHKLLTMQIVCPNRHNQSQNTANQKNPFCLRSISLKNWTLTLSSWLLWCLTKWRDFYGLWFVISSCKLYAISLHVWYLIYISSPSVQSGVMWAGLLLFYCKLLYSIVILYLCIIYLKELYLYCSTGRCWYGI